MFLNYILKKIIVSIFVFFGVIFLTFLLTYIIPGDPLVGLIGQQTDFAVIASLREKFGLNEPFLIQFKNYLSKILHGDLGTSFYTQQKVSVSLLYHFSFTLRLAILAIIIASILGFFLGITAFLNKGKLLDFLSIVFVLFGTSFPVFWVGLLFLYFLSLRFSIFSSSSIILPALTLGLRPAAFIARTTRAKMLEVFSQDYIKTALAKGLPFRRVLFRHALANVSLTIITLIALDLGNLLAGAAITETVFSYPGIGKFLLDGILRRDYPVIMGTVFFVAIIFVFINLIVDIFYVLFDPRIKYAK